ncbi:histone-lysine N-methyltransferase set1-like [Anopheles maculipalpis]|uniref:histone-lysine N-methyltransferase set1-like n=1 Tax=Anopheles maculipalpis TaxID=1496333 RepID=UPI0021594C65|nr:histone-lysine N-methyltransferase set1-like [Anopheles maculipalpis]
MVYYNDRQPVETVPSPYYWPNENILPSDEPDAIHYPTWFQLPWRPFPLLQQPVAEEEPEAITVSPEVEPPPPTTTEMPDETPEGRHLHHEKPHKHHHHHKHKHHKHKHHHHHEKGTKTAATPFDDSEDLQSANVGQLKMVILQLENKLQELKLQLFGSRTLTNDENEDDAARFEVPNHSNSDPEASEEMEHLLEELSNTSTDVTTPTTVEKDEGKLLLEGQDKPTAELVLEHREIEPNPFDNGRSLAENVQKWFEGLDLGKIAALPLEDSVESEDVSGIIDVRGQF